MCKENLLFVWSHAARLGCRHCRAGTLPFAQLRRSWDFSHAVLCVCSSVGQGPPAGETVNAQGTVKSPVDGKLLPCPRACGQRGISASQIWFDNHFCRVVPLAGRTAALSDVVAVFMSLRCLKSYSWTFQSYRPVRHCSGTWIFTSEVSDGLSAAWNIPPWLPSKDRP